MRTRVYPRRVTSLYRRTCEPELARCYRSYAQVRDGIGQTEEATVLRRRADDIYLRLRGAAARE